MNFRKLQNLIKRNFIVVLFATLVFACTTTNQSAGTPTKYEQNKKSAHSSLQKDVQVLYLQNKIPLYIKNVSTSRKNVISIVVKGGTSYLSRETSGLESALFSMMTQGSASYSYDELMHIFYETNCSLSPSSSRESSSLTLSCIDYYFEKLFPLFADSFLHPTFNDEQFNNLLTSYKQNLQRLQTDPQSLLSYEMTNAIFQNHPYATSSAVKPYSIQNITLENIKKLHEEILDSRRIFIVAVGNFNKSKLLKNLDTTIGKIPALTSELKTQNIFPLDVKPGNTVITNEAAAGTGFLEKVMRGPSVYDDDMIAASIASSMYSSVLFNVVREKYGACYTPSASVTAMKAGLASVHIFRASDLQNIIKYENEAHKIFESGFVIDGKNEDGSYIFSPIAERLEGYKNQYINSFYGSSLSSTNIASRMVYSIVMFDSPYSYDEKIMSVQNVSALDVKNAFEKYFCKNGAWFAVVGKEDKSSIKFTSD